MRKLAVLGLVLGMLLAVLPLQAQEPGNTLPAPLMVEMGASFNDLPRGKVYSQSTGLVLPDQTNDWEEQLLYTVLSDTTQAGVRVVSLILNDIYMPFWWPNEWDVSPDRRSILIRLDQPIVEGERILQIDNYYEASSDDLPVLVDLSAYNESYSQTVSYRLNPQLHYAAGIVGHDLLVGDLTRDHWQFTPIENWLPHGIEIRNVGVTFDPLERQAFVRVTYLLPVPYLTQYISFLVDLTSLDAAPEQINLLSLNWSPDGQYAIASGPDNNLTLLYGDTLAPVRATNNDPIALADVVDFIWQPAGDMAYYIQVLAVGECAYELYALDLATGGRTRLMDLPYSRHYPSFVVNDGGDFGLLEVLPPPMTSGYPYRFYVDLQIEGEFDWSAGLQSLTAPRLSPTQDWIVTTSAITDMLARYFFAAKDGVPANHVWYGLALARGWTADGAPIIQTFDPAQYPEHEVAVRDDWLSLPEPGWYALDMDADGNLLWETFDCGLACNVNPTDFDKSITAQYPDDPLFFAVEGSSPAGDGLHLVNLRDGTADLLMSYGPIDGTEWQEWRQVLRVEWLAPDAFPQPEG